MVYVKATVGGAEASMLCQGIAAVRVLGGQRDVLRYLGTVKG